MDMVFRVDCYQGCYVINPSGGKAFHVKVKNTQSSRLVSFQESVKLQHILCSFVVIFEHIQNNLKNMSLHDGSIHRSIERLIDH